MFPDWPDSAADLIPLPPCEGPKLKPFDFQGPQKIDFLEYLGEGRHSFVFKVQILGRIYALKLFRFDHAFEWARLNDDFDQDNHAAMSAVYNYADPFSCECRSFGRLQEAGHEELAVDCFGYLLLDEEHERIMRDKFKDDPYIFLEFDGNTDGPGCYKVRSRYPGKSGKLRPIRGIVKEFGTPAETMQNKDLRRILRNITQLHQLGIIGIDMADRQLISGRICDFSTAITIPHFITNPELNPYLTAAAKSAMEYETFLYSINDYWLFDDMVDLWNEEHEDQKTPLSVFAFPGGNLNRNRYNLRSTPSRDGIYSFVNPMKCNWRAFSATTESGVNAPSNMTKRGPRQRQRQRLEAGGQKLKSGRVNSKRRAVRLDAKPRRWYLNCSQQVAAVLKIDTWFTNTLAWEFKSGVMFPHHR
ncbi:kinetochore sim4 complex subunit FTA2 domain-containing protein [Pochonia chlamydosporia 170]|uniref:Kinetochore sim4 complex subunit FTA2 domain-containing protein n=1 Tax=Pochonia chlamydosporia 170 TaxID=1380566 RepID=A0A179G4W7_METCM|nr:kinetochore sim4 complex subunit FTA2 domain-containing protein [Pochonia chlamydosporia 170]OAQ72508.1 kinetochore sim4 complex subunit FTA2 domain-containing protein [Pochonia chlamydosporia 170]